MIAAAGRLRRVRASAGSLDSARRARPAKAARPPGIGRMFHCRLALKEVDRWTGGSVDRHSESPGARSRRTDNPPLESCRCTAPLFIRLESAAAAAAPPLPRRRSGSTFRPGPDAPARPGFPSRHDHAHRNPRRSRRPRRRPVDGRRDAADSPLDDLCPRPRRQLPRRVPLLALREPESGRAGALPHRAGGRRRGRGVRVRIGGDDDAVAGARPGFPRHRPRRRLLRHDQARARHASDRGGSSCRSST